MCRSPFGATEDRNQLNPTVILTNERRPPFWATKYRDINTRIADGVKYIVATVLRDGRASQQRVPHAVSAAGCGHSGCHPGRPGDRNVETVADKGIIKACGSNPFQEAEDRNYQWGDTADQAWAVGGRPPRPRIAISTP